MTIHKNIFLLLLLLLFSNHLLAYGATGHARQQLRLIASEQIDEALSRAVMTLNLPELPLTLMEGQTPELKHQLDVLVAESLLQRDDVVALQRELTANGWVQRNTAGVRYYRDLDRIGQPVRFGNARLNRVGEVMTDPQPDGRTIARIRFSWQAIQLDEWVWAPAFDGDARLNRIKTSLDNPVEGTATLEWQQDQWVLTSLRPFTRD
ncbi:hypothetical protein [Saccharospirillum salsuginis]|uniref:Uncharacterized protein n=1 Tax=Saccharospirillum salsuginis TaxID=418750 RepID=A0A918KIE8_9GAMM|nr:hypothetical protein [Saccharospirillum salsuginis]GGX64439.1 hypothetical protein GCM10007392_35260 [Saccharospirillum salsuginis]